MLAITGCSGTIGLYHHIEGGAIAQSRAAPPGADAPYPNLANVPPEPAALPAGTQAAIAAQSHGAAPGISAPSPGALAGLAIPSAPPPPPGVAEPAQTDNAAAPPQMPAATPPSPAAAPPLSIAFPPGTAILPHAMLAPIAAFAAKRGAASVIAGGFGDDQSLTLAIARARRIADALTADGVPASAIRLTAAPSGSGGFAQLVY
ncbi:MAG: hypothetical protein POH28_08810 [Acidocella sp.]|nr:hypothetical protein [Acidocella sp.]